MIELSNITQRKTYKNSIVFNGKKIWSENIDANVQKEIVLDPEEGLSDDNLYEILTRNMSGVTAIIIQPKVVWNDVDGNEREAAITDLWEVATNSGDASLVQGAFMGEGCKIILENASSLGAGEGFTGYVQIRKV